MSGFSVGPNNSDFSTPTSQPGKEMSPLDLDANIRPGEFRKSGRNSDIIAIADGHRANAINKDMAHHLASVVFARRNRLLGVPATVIAAVVGSSIFATLASNEKHAVVMVATGLLSIGAAILSALQTFLRYAETAQAHKTSASGYGAIRRKINLFKLEANNGMISGKGALEALKQIAAELNDLGGTSPAIDNRLYEKAIKRIATHAAHHRTTLTEYDQQYCL